MQRARIFVSLAFVCAFSVRSAAAQTAHPCLPCHPQQVESFARSAMAQTLSSPRLLPKASLHPPGSQVDIQIDYKNGQMVHRESLNGVTSQYLIRYAVGSGLVGQSFLAEIGTHLVQSPASYYTGRQKWDLTPGYEGAPIPASRNRSPAIASSATPARPPARPSIDSSRAASSPLPVNAAMAPLSNIANTPPPQISSIPPSSPFASATACASNVI